jgi:hypothetical protein
MTDSPYTVSWFFGHDFLGQGVASPWFKWGSPFVHNSNAYYCPTCGDVWARIHVDSPASRWCFIARECAAHGLPFLLQYDTAKLNDSAPLCIWAREFLLAFSFAEAGGIYDTYLVDRSGVFPGFDSPASPSTPPPF